MNDMSCPPVPLPAPHERVAALRCARGETLEAFGALIGGASKGVMSELERGLRKFTADQALAIERLSAEAGGEVIDAGELSELVRRARDGLGSVHAPADSLNPGAGS